jgi:hypothetical protein
MSTSTFTDAKRIQTSLLSGVEKRILYWFAAECRNGSTQTT